MDKVEALRLHGLHGFTDFVFLQLLWADWIFDLGVLLEKAPGGRTEVIGK
jgi:hypothetical protein